MDENEIHKLINRILSGYKFVGKYVIDIPSAKLLAQGDNIYQQFLHDNRFENIISETQVKFLLLKNGLWSLSEESALKDLPKKIEDCKVDLYNALLIPTRQRRVRDQIAAYKQQYKDLFAKRSVFEHCTIEFLANYERERFIFSNIILNNNFEKITIRPILLDRIMAESKKNNISVKKYRELARNDHWGNIWEATKLSAFREIGEEQRTLIAYTKLYSSINQHPDKPPTAVINDDDMLDGWMIYTKDKQEKEQKADNIAKNKNIMAKGNEQFIMTSPDPEDIQSVLDMNDTRAKVIQKKIHTMVEKDGVANEFNIQEIRQDALINLK